VVVGELTGRIELEHVEHAHAEEALFAWDDLAILIRLRRLICRRSELIGG
jgi:hypothetical protein